MPAGGSNEWPQRGLFIGCLLVGTVSVLALDFVLAPAIFTSSSPPAPTSPVSATVPPSTSATPPSSEGQEPPAAAPTRTRVPKIVAYFTRASKEADEEATIRLLATAMIEEHAATIRLEGHGDTAGVDDRSLGAERARWVKARLVDRGVSEERVETAAGVATDAGVEDGSSGGRVEVHWTETAPPEGEARK